MSPLEWSAALVSALSVYLGVRQHIWVWPTGLVGVALYAVVFYDSKLYADMGLQVFYVAAQVYGWWAWLHGGQGGSALSVTRTPRAWLSGFFVGGAALSFALGLALHTYTDAALPYLDSTLSAYSVVAQWQMTRKWVESWLVWIAVDVVYIGLFLVKQLYPTAVLYAVFLVLATLGWREWRRSMASSSVSAAA